MLSVSFTFNNPLDVNSSLTCRSSKNPNEEIFVSYMVVDHDFTKTLGIEVVMGRNLSTDSPQLRPMSLLIRKWPELWVLKTL